MSLTHNKSAARISPSASVFTSVFDHGEPVRSPRALIDEHFADNLTSHRPLQQNQYPRRVYINDTNVIVPSAFAHLGTDETQCPPAGAGTHDRAKEPYRRKSLDRHGRIDCAGHRSEYRVMRGFGLCEDVFATFGKETFLLHERQSYGCKVC